MPNPKIININNDRASRQWNRLLFDANNRADFYEAAYLAEREEHYKTWQKLNENPTQDAKPKSLARKLVCAFSVVWRSAWRL